MDLCLVHNEVAGVSTALKLFSTALLCTQLLILPVMKRESCRRKPAVASGASESCQGVLLGMRREGESPGPCTAQPSSSPDISSYPPWQTASIPALVLINCLSDSLFEIRLQDKPGIRNQEDQWRSGFPHIPTQQRETHRLYQLSPSVDSMVRFKKIFQKSTISSLKTWTFPFPQRSPWQLLTQH